ncbi:hypothetical protein [Baaleninema sp.]|uniref:hypothetical protein n=1 Tax=Baaleninema sp. TaxID=3101197 RepID=UPI003D072FEB
MRTLVISSMPLLGYRLGALAMAIALSGLAISQAISIHFSTPRTASKSDDTQDTQSVLLAGRGEESDKCEWLGNCDD